ncbi:MAG: VWA domain-containing protein [Syntrophales bacterium LBB04]|nr:VWA domain-containing protein [Syntrophales bacterium LBB04]
MKTRKILTLVMGVAFMFLTFGLREALASEESLFMTSTSPDALIVLDLSGSMAWNPAGDDLTYGSTDSCYPDSANCSGTGCSGGYCGSSKSAVTYYAASACGTPDTANCVGTNCSNGYCSVSKGATTFYTSSSTSCTTPDTFNCSGSGCGRTDGFCNNSVTGTTFYAHDSSCTADTYNCRWSESWSDCANGFCASSHSSSRRSCAHACTTAPCNHSCTTTSCSTQCVSGGCTKSCSRLAIAKRSIFNILDDNNDNTVNSADETSLGVRLGYMRFYGCGDDDTGNSYTSGCNSLIKSIGSSYSSINTSVQSESASGGTPLASALREAKLYLDDNKAADASRNCRQKFVIMITDGSDTYSCDADGSECDSDRYQNRREVVAKTKALRDAGYKVFVIGFGAAMPPYLRNTLNWMAYYGGTDNPHETNTGNPLAYSLPMGCNSVTNPTACCNTTASACYPSGVTGCQTDSSTLTAACYDSTKPYCTNPATCPGWSTSSYRASSNDPGYLDLSGYAFLATDADQLVAAVKAAMNIIREATYSFSQASVQSSRTADENYLYEGSFQPVSGDPFWPGHLKKYQINADGTVGSQVWDAGTVLQSTSESSRVIKTYTGGSMVDFTTVNMTPAILGVATTADRDAVVGYFRGVWDSTCPTSGNCYNPENWKLGDVFRSVPITVGTPTSYFDDLRDANNAFAAYRTSNTRTSANGMRIIVAGANDGQFHAFNTSNGSEVWSFIPPNLLPKLKNIAHSTYTTSLLHQYYVDGPVKVSDVWLGSGSGTSKAATEWKTMLIFGEGRGSNERLWSTSSSCDSGLAGNYNAATSYTNYCGIYALDITNTLSPSYLWRINSFNATTQGPYMGESWSKMVTGRVLISGNEKWVGFIGGGWNAGSCASGSCDTRGKGFFVVDLSNGQVLWSYTYYNNTTSLVYSMAATPTVVDKDNDGFIDTAYIGDLGGNMWRFRFCKASDSSSCGPTGSPPWSGELFYNASTSGSTRPIYTAPAVTKDQSGNYWVSWGTGDKTDPTLGGTQDYFYTLQDVPLDLTTRTIANFAPALTGSQTFDTASTFKGFRIQLSTGEKVLADSTTFGGVTYFTTFLPYSGTDPCQQGGYAYLYAIDYRTGKGVLPGDAKYMSVGTGIPSAPIISMKPDLSGADLYVTASGGGLSSASTGRVNFDPPLSGNRTNLLYWRDKKIR